MMADLLTKPKVGKEFERLTKLIMNTTEDNESRKAITDIISGENLITSSLMLCDYPGVLEYIDPTPEEGGFGTHETQNTFTE